MPQFDMIAFRNIRVIYLNKNGVVFTGLILAVAVGNGYIIGSKSLIFIRNIYSFAASASAPSGIIPLRVTTCSASSPLG